MKIFDCFMYYDEDLIIDLRLNLLNNFNINTIEYDLTSKENFYNISEIERTDYAYDNKHIGALTNEHVFNYVKEQL